MIRQCKHFQMDYPDGQRVLVCPCCTKFWELKTRKRPVGEVLRDWVDSVGSRIYAATLITMIACTVIATVKYVGDM